MIEKELHSILAASTGWTQIYGQLASHNSGEDSSAGKLFEYFCKYYYLTEPTAAPDYKNVWLYEEAPQKVKEKLNLSKNDRGVDLILENHDGMYTEVQCKFRNDQSSRLSWSKDKIANLFAEADRADFIILFTNASDLDEYSKGKHAKKFHLVTVGELLQLQPETIQQMGRSIAHKTAIIKLARKPREDQIIAIKKVLKGFQNHDRGQLILPCGAGKTLVSLWIKEQLNPKRTLVLVPSLALLRQIKNEWQSTQKSWFPYLCVCSEGDIDNGADMPVVHTYEIGGRVTTEPHEIWKFLSKHHKSIIYCTYQSLDAISMAVRSKDLQFDFAICDEAHKTAGSKIGTFGLIHDNTKVPIRKRLYMTATPRIVSEQAKTILGEDKIKFLADMNDPALFGPEFHRMSFAEAIRKKILVDYQIIAIGISDADLQKQVLERQYAGDDETTIEDIANNYALEKIMKKYGATHAITFHSTIKRAEQFKERHQKLFPKIDTDHVSGLQTTNGRSVIMNQFKNSNKAVITNARCLTEGVDVPTIDVVYFCDPKNSKIDIVQASGRALRRAVHKNKQFGYIVVPVFHREREKVNDALESSAFKNLISVVRALCDQDERLADEINRIKIGKGVRKPTSQSAYVKIEDELPLIVLENFEEKLKRAIFSQLIEKAGDNWMVIYELVKEFRKSNPRRWPNLHAKDEKEKMLARWLSHRRSEYKDGILSKKRIEALENIGFPWNRFDEKWDEMYNKLILFRKHNPSRWPSHSVATKDAEERKLSNWCVAQRMKCKKGLLSNEQITKLKSMEFPFDPLQNKFEIFFTELVRFKQNKKRWPSSMAKDPIEKSLGRKCNRLRKAFRKGNLSKNLVTKLNKLRFPWNPNYDRWEMMITLLTSFFKKNQARRPSYHSTDPIERKIAVFYVQCRQRYKKGKLRKNQIEQLKKIGVPLDISNEKETRWMNNYKQFIQFNNKHPNRQPSHGSTNIEERKIGQWCNNQRRNYHLGTLDPKKKSLLNKIHFPWVVLEQRDLAKLGQLKSFRKKHPDRLPNRFSHDPLERSIEKKYSRWKNAYNKGKLDEHVKTELKKLGLLIKFKTGPKPRKNLVRSSPN